MLLNLSKIDSFFKKDAFQEMLKKFNHCYFRMLGNIAVLNQCLMSFAEVFY